MMGNDHVLILERFKGLLAGVDGKADLLNRLLSLYLKTVGTVWVLNFLNL